MKRSIHDVCVCQMQCLARQHTAQTEGPGVNEGRQCVKEGTSLSIIRKEKVQCKDGGAGKVNGINKSEGFAFSTGTNSEVGGGVADEGEGSGLKGVGGGAVGWRVGRGRRINLDSTSWPRLFLTQVFVNR